jgi:diadenosine tetraphosphate (Ap4A) HIT family hydrolase
MNQSVKSPDPKPCLFCLDNGLLVGEVIATSAGAYLIEASSSTGNYLIIPRAHIESLLELPDAWWHEVKALLPQVPDLAESYNLSINIGKAAGQSMQHLHFWVVPRAEGQPASGKGLAKLVDEFNQA